MMVKTQCAHLFSRSECILPFSLFVHELVSNHLLIYSAKADSRTALTLLRTLKNTNVFNIIFSQRCCSVFNSDYMD